MASPESNSCTVCEPDGGPHHEKASVLEASGQQTAHHTPRSCPTLATVDRGFAAWATLAASCMMGLFVFGFPKSAGVFLAAYLEDPLYTGQQNATTLLPLIGTFNMGVLYCGGILVTPSIRYHPPLRKISTWVGIAICFASLLAASFTTDVRMLIVSEGVGFGIGAALVYCPLVSYMNEWFVERRGLANGILFAADNVGGILFPIIIPLLVSRFGIGMTLRIYAIALALCLLPAALLLKARSPQFRARTPAPQSESGPRHWLRDRRFWFFIMLNTLQGLANFMPLTWLPTFATSLGVSESKASLVLTLANGATAVSGFGAGWLSDRFSIWALAVSSLLLSTLATFVLWGIAASSYAGVLVFGVSYGLTAGGWSSLWSGFGRPIAGSDASLATTIFTLMLFTRGIGNFASTPISTALQSTKASIPSRPASRTGFAVDKSRFYAVIIYTGACFAVAVVVAIVGWALDRRSSAGQSKDRRRTSQRSCSPHHSFIITSKHRTGTHTDVRHPSKIQIDSPKDDLHKVSGDLEKHLDALPELVFTPALPPVDRGFDAWSTLVASCVMGLFVFGFPNSFGALLAAFLKDKVYSSQEKADIILPLIGTICTGILYCSGVVIHPMIRYYPRLRKVFVWAGPILCVASLLAASFTTKIMTLLALEGIMFGIGASLIYCPLVASMSEWFVERRGLANGIIVAADNAGGVIFPIIMPALIARFGIAMTTRIYAIALAICSLPAAYFLKSRIPANSTPHGKLAHFKTSSTPSSSRSWLYDRRFWFFMSMNVLQGVGHFVPTTWLPTFGTSLGLTEGQASLALTLANGTMTISALSIGWLSDYLSIWALAFASLSLSCLATTLLWGVAAASFAGVLACGAVYGLTAGCWSSLWSGFVRPIAADDPALATTIFSFLFFGRGVGNLVSTPITTALQKAMPNIANTSTMPRIGFAVDGGQYMGVIAYGSACFAAGAGVTIVGWILERRRACVQKANGA